MLKEFFIICLTIISLNFIVPAQDNSWLEKLKKIKPLESTEKDVEEFLGKPQKRYADIGEYEIEEGIISINYSEGRCTSASASEFDLDKGTVISFNFTPGKTIRFSSLGLDLTSLSKEVITDVADSQQYYDEEKGISYSVHRGILNFVEFSGGKDAIASPCSEVKQEEILDPQ